MPIPGF